MLRPVSIGLVAAAALFLSAGDLFAQGSGFGGQNLGGGGGGGGGMSGSSSGGGFGSTGMGSSMGGMNNSGLSMMYAATLSGGFGVLGFGGANGFGASTSMYGGRSYGAATSAGGGSSMAGSTSGGSRSTSGTSGSASRGGGGTAGGGRGGRSRNGSTNTSQQEVWFEPKVEIGFEVPPTSTSTVAKTVAGSLGTSKPKSQFAGVQVFVSGSVAILRGTVASTYDKQLAEQIALFEPSITAVRDELTVTAPAAHPPAAPLIPGTPRKASQP